MRPPTMTDVLRARRVVARHLPPTPVLSAPVLDALTGARVLVKLENTQPTGAFKVRGGLTLLAGMEPAERARGVVGYSTGNHAQSLAFAAARYGAPCVIVMPERPNPAKAGAVRALGAELVEAGSTVDECREVAAGLAGRRGMRLVDIADEPALIAGVGTAYLEILERHPDVDVILVPLGGGSSAASACLVTAALAPGCEVIAVQSASSPAGYDSWRSGRLVERPNRTVAEGLATGAGYPLTQAILRDRLSGFLLVDDVAIRAAQWILLRDAHLLAEGAGAAAMAGVLADPDRFAGRTVAVMCSGGNAGEAELRAVVPATP